MLDVGDDPAGQCFDGRVIHPVAGWVVGIAVVAGRGDDRDAGRGRHGPHPLGASAAADRGHLDEGGEPGQGPAQAAQEEAGAAEAEQAPPAAPEADADLEGRSG